MDTLLTQAVNNLSGQWPTIDQIMIGITNYGIFAVVAVVVTFWWKPNNRLKMRHACIVSGLSFLLSLGFNQLLLLFIHRLRPYDTGVTHLLVAANPDWSFPSDHATASSAIIASLWFKGQKTAAYILAAPAMLICFSRVYVGVHYTSDICGGVTIGILTALAVSKLYDEQSKVARFGTSLPLL